MIYSLHHNLSNLLGSEGFDIDVSDASLYVRKLHMNVIPKGCYTFLHHFAFLTYPEGQA